MARNAFEARQLGLTQINSAYPHGTSWKLHLENVLLSLKIEGVRMPGRAVVFGLEYAIKGKGK